MTKGQEIAEELSETVVTLTDRERKQLAARIDAAIAAGPCNKCTADGVEIVLAKMEAEAIAAEREACARVAETAGASLYHAMTVKDAARAGRTAAAAAIRARGSS